MSRAVSATAKNLLRWLGYDMNLLPQDFQNLVKVYSENGAVQKVGEIEAVDILQVDAAMYRNDGSSPAHKSSFNSKDEELVVSARIPKDGSAARTHHIFANGTVTIKKGDKK